ncbi:UDP-glucose 4-epimerase [Bacilli bacterium PM5-3]|nr:UDP-glucose 4-epimerase [Bacilli bacterium PM5-3]MDH6604356.1 UDP-glucose 4-epimerase [Bacilli bacterium PM5-9]
MNVLIIGGAGYIGSHQVKIMLEANHNVIVYDNLSTGHQDKVDKKAVFVKGDIRDYDLLKKTIIKYKIDAIMHFAALSIVSDSMNRALEYYDNNVYGFQVLLNVMRDTNVKNIIFSSTAAVYGKQDKMPIDEKAMTIPSNPYGETKLTMEKMIKWAALSNDFRYVILRYFNVAGASLDGSVGELHNPETHLIPIVLEVALNKREKLFVNGNDYNTKDGTCIRDYIHVLDLCQAHKLALDYLVSGNKSDTFNLGYGYGYSVIEIIESARKVCQHELLYEIAPRRQGDPDVLIASCDKVKDVLKWQPKYNDINIIIESAYNFIEKNK